MEQALGSSTFLCPHCNVMSLHQLVGTPSDYQQTITLKGKDGKNYRERVAMQHRIYLEFPEFFYPKSKHS
jgi:hypothetical protein